MVVWVEGKGSGASHISVVAASLIPLQSPGHRHNALDCKGLHYADDSSAGVSDQNEVE
jgi:hypothetical protein